MKSLVAVRLLRTQSIGGTIKFKVGELTPMKSLVAVRLLRTQSIGGNIKFKVGELTPMKSLVQFDYSELSL